MTMATSERFERIALDRLCPSTTNPRNNFDQAALEELAASVREKGVLQPVLVRPQKRPVKGGDAKGKVLRDAGVVERTGIYELVAGERRVRAAKLAGLAEIPAIVRELTDLQVLGVQLSENDQRSGISPLERAAGYQRLVDEHGYTVEALAGKSGRSVSTVRGLLKLVLLPEKARQAVEAGELPVSTAELIARIPNEK